MSFKKEMQIGGRTLSLETGAVARQANGACVIRFADTVERGGHSPFSGD